MRNPLRRRFSPAAEIAGLRAELAAVTKERDEARAGHAYWFGAAIALGREVRRQRAAIRRLGGLDQPPTPGTVSTQEGQP